MTTTEIKKCVEYAEQIKTMKEWPYTVVLNTEALLSGEVVYNADKTMVVNNTSDKKQIFYQGPKDKIW